MGSPMRDEGRWRRRTAVMAKCSRVKRAVEEEEEEEMRRYISSRVEKGRVKRVGVVWVQGMIGGSIGWI